jgi:hypothetical protein
VISSTALANASSKSTGGDGDVLKREPSVSDHRDDVVIHSHNKGIYGRGMLTAGHEIPSAIALLKGGSRTSEPLTELRPRIDRHLELLAEFVRANPVTVGLVSLLDGGGVAVYAPRAPAPPLHGPSGPADILTVADTYQHPHSSL